VERGDRSDGPWGDDPHGPDDPRGSDDWAAAYPPAPLPAHERAWRHPSELGQAQWAMSEPPLVVGRGLLAATGAIGTVLGLAVLWMLVPVGFDNDRGGPTAGPDVTRSVQTLAAVTTVSAADGSTPGSRGGGGDGRDDDSESGGAAGTGATLPSESVPPNTVRLSAAPRGSGTPAPAASRPAIAVMVNGSGLLLTTAAAVATLGEVALDDQHTGQHDDPLIAQVVAVDQGVALLAPSGSGDAPLDVLGFDAIATAAAGDPVVVLGADPVEATYPEAGEPLDLGAAGGDDAVDVAALAEGTPVVDTDGALVGLCTMVVTDDGGATMHIVPVAALFGAAPSADVEPPATDADPATPGAPGTADQAAWIGVQLSAGTDHIGALIDSIVPQSPADTAGLRVGEVIIAVDGQIVTDVADLLAAMATRRVGDVVVLTVLEPTDATAMASSRLISVLLAAAAPSA
jgi:hypothetical protein